MKAWEKLKQLWKDSLSVYGAFVVVVVVVVVVLCRSSLMLVTCKMFALEWREGNTKTDIGSPF